MEKYQKILVCLDHSKIDANLIKAANRICELSPREITFVNVIRDHEVPEEMMKQFPNFMENATKERTKEIRAEIDKFFAWPDMNVDTQVVHGQPAKAILKIANEKNADLIISGKKQNSLGVVRSRLARRADCSFLMVSKGFDFEIKRILVPIDFSHHSRLALERAVSLAKLMRNPVEIFAQNVYQLPSGYHYTGKTQDEFIEIMKKNAIEGFENFIKSVDTDGMEIKTIYSLNDNDDFVSDIKAEAQNLNADLIIIGAKGQTTASGLFIGSRAERMVMMNTHSSMLVVRIKGKKSGFKDFLKEL
ncbi:MAG: universal stress protein [Cytophagales bacterium]|nr:universal stress protein [Cytophagales bacterium]